MVQLSVIIPIFDTPPEILERCLNAISKISKVNYETLVIDDGSKKYNYTDTIRKYPDTKLYRKKNGGVSSARNLGLKKASGQYIAFVDSDDVFAAKNVSWNLFKKNYDIIIYDMAKFSSNCQTQIFKTTGEIAVNDALKIFISGTKLYSACAKFYKRHFLLSNSIEFNSKTINGEDALFNLDCFEKSPSIYYKNRVIYLYDFTASHYDNRVKNNLPIILDNYLYKYKKNLMIIEKHNFSKRYKINIENAAIRQMFRIDLILAKADHSVKKCAQEMHISLKELSFKNHIKYHMVVDNRFSLAFRFLAVMRKIRLRSRRTN